MNKNKYKKIFNVRGSSTLPPNDYFFWNFLKYKIEFIINSYGYLNIKTSFLEYKKLFYKSLGLGSEIIENQIYNINTSLNSKILCLKPENTVALLKLYLNNDFINFKFGKFWYSDYLFRHENPQKNRYREFYQIGLEIFNDNSIYIELELIFIVNEIFIYLNINNLVKLEINTIGKDLDRNIYKSELFKNFKLNIHFFDKKDIVKIYKNPIKILDLKKNDFLIKLKIPQLYNFINLISFKKFEKIKVLLKKFNIKFFLNKNLVRGLDYYNDFVFEWIDILDSKNSLVGGGRYDYLSLKISPLSIPACGLGIGFNRVLNIYKKKNIILSINFNLYLFYDMKLFFQGLSIIKKLKNIGLNIFFNKFDFNSKYFVNNFFCFNSDFLLFLEKRLFKFKFLKLIYVKNFYNKNFYIGIEKIISLNNLYKFFINYIYKY